LWASEREKKLISKSKEILIINKTYTNKREFYSRVHRLSDTRYLASVNASLYFSGISIDIGE